MLRPTYIMLITLLICILALTDCLARQAFPPTTYFLAAIGFLVLAVFGTTATIAAILAYRQTS